MIDIERIPNAVYFPHIEVSATIERATNRPMSMVIFAYYALPSDDGAWEVFEQIHSAGYDCNNELHRETREPRMLHKVRSIAAMNALLSDHMTLPVGGAWSNSWLQNSREWRPLPESKSAP